MTVEQSAALYEAKFWEKLTEQQKALFQIFEDKLCMPFDVFHESVEKTIGRSVQIIEFGVSFENLRNEVIESFNKK